MRYMRSEDVRGERAVLLGVALGVAIATLMSSPAPRASVLAEVGEPALPLIAPDDPLVRNAMPGDPLTCTERAAIPQVDNAYDAAWAPDSRHLAVSTILTVPNARTVTGAEEQQRLSILDVATGKTRDLGRGRKPSWSGSGLYLSYWRDGDLRVISGSGLAALIPSSQPDVRWVGDTLYFFNNGEIRVWKDGLSWTIAHVHSELVPLYPRDDVYFSADGEWFTMTRYYSSGDVQRYRGLTATGWMDPVGDGNTLFTQWAPVGHDLLLRSAGAVSVIAGDGSTRNADARTLAGPVHAWTADGRLLFGKMSPTVTTNVDSFVAFDDAGLVAKVPNLLGVRTFSPDGAFFAGTSRTGLYSTQLDVYRCGTLPGDDARADNAARAGTARIESDPRRFVRPVSGAISQYLQGNHTGIDVSAPVGAIIVAADDGVVTAVGHVPVGGRRVCVLHAGDLESCGYHTSLPLVAIGDHVVRGQPVALVGMTGMTTGPHVHWEAKRDGMVVDPLKQ
jgi:murein DD-endopeptidase MepM/ murein hydrolase activator NlpD